MFVSPISNVNHTYSRQNIGAQKASTPSAQSNINSTNILSAGTQIHFGKVSSVSSAEKAIEMLKSSAFGSYVKLTTDSKFNSCASGLLDKGNISELVLKTAIGPGTVAKGIGITHVSGFLTEEYRNLKKVTFVLEDRIQELQLPKSLDSRRKALEVCSGKREGYYELVANNDESYEIAQKAIQEVRQVHGIEDFTLTSKSF